MLAQILVAILIVAVAVMVAVDLVRTKTDDPTGQHEGSAYEVRPRAVGGHTGASFGTGIPAAGQDVGPAQRPGGVDPSVAAYQPPRADSPVAQASSTERATVPPAQGNRHVRSRLRTMVAIPAAAVAVVALCIVG